MRDCHPWNLGSREGQGHARTGEVHLTSQHLTFIDRYLVFPFSFSFYRLFYYS